MSSENNLLILKLLLLMAFADKVYMEEEKELINECIDTGWISSEGPFVEKFELELRKKINRKYGIACSNGTY